MPIWNGLRRRISSQQLSSYLVDEDYTSNRRGRASREDSRDSTADIDSDSLMRMGLMHSSSTEGPEEPRRMSVMDNVFDPDEPVPSYESSQEHHHRNRPDFQVGVDCEDRLRHSVDSTPPNECSTPPPPPPLDQNTYSFSDPSSLASVNSNSSSRSTLIHQNGSLRPFYESRRSRNGRESREQSREPQPRKRSLKNLGLKFLNARQHFLLAVCRDVSLIPCIMGLCESWWIVFIRSEKFSSDSAGITTARGSEHFLEGIWCIVAGYLSYSVLDGLMVRWIVTYSTTGAIVRMLSMSTILVAIEQYLVSAFSAEGYQYGLHTWILISCALTLLYIVQNFVTSNIDLKGKRRARFFDFYNIVVFAVVPVGLASFITMIGLLRSLLILRLDIEEQRR
ncbi:hypothetical protein FT663_04735 [Candidozyma haemuli var. vulneris]|uniref:N-glycosylation protein EOS1 n=1 Tax=Candidozyma haemuli TaxID=45357 RepID=A0A2V1AQ48_9ASCO|nr:hypothetical protein CXQ85_001983 [[Candida] haemuloni]KAF3984936.1 hypothetical protein FT662_05454 [[Candida] haemuloni var. vulneris]KAF3986791.1 hypothetical protein FT663_04735 [[Candida] haemuloni var. vulneris]PVH20200.1 hypothetical protein CXQ85_001983 [[Candida] haemuloni]